MTATTLIVGCEGSGDTQISTHSSALTYNNSAATDADHSEVLNSTNSTALDSEAINSTNIENRP